MTTLYEILNGITDEDVSKDYTPQEIEFINNQICRATKSKLGDAAFGKLERYIVDNKDDPNLRILTAQVSIQVMMGTNYLDLLSVLPETVENDYRMEAKFNYMVLKRLYKKLGL